MITVVNKSCKVIAKVNDLFRLIQFLKIHKQVEFIWNKIWNPCLKSQV